jgi:hypothetical protein
MPYSDDEMDYDPWSELPFHDDATDAASGSANTPKIMNNLLTT